VPGAENRDPGDQKDGGEIDQLREESLDQAPALELLIDRGPTKEPVQQRGKEPDADADPQDPGQRVPQDVAAMKVRGEPSSRSGRPFYSVESQTWVREVTERLQKPFP